MKAKELRNLHNKELYEKMSEIKKELMKENAQIALGGTPKNPGKVRATKRTIARIMTLLHQKVQSKQKEMTSMSKEKQLAQSSNAVKSEAKAEVA
jgi:large subunit ribosomal protein L29